jgi:hypothetical protein
MQLACRLEQPLDFTPVLLPPEQLILLCHPAGSLGD